jgi:hypothetical protein
MAEPIFNSAWGGGVRSGSALADLMQQRVQRSQLQQLAQMASQPNVDYQQLGAGFIGAGLPGAGVNAMQIPYQRDQNELDRAFRRDQLGFQRDQAAQANDWRQRNFDADQGYRADTLALKQAEIEAKRAEAQAEAAKPNFSDENSLRKDFQNVTKDYRESRDAFQRIQASAQNPSPAGDLALIFNFMKVLDPGSTVREGEFATAQNSAGVPGRIKSLYNSVINGQRLNKEQRMDFVTRAQGLFQKAQNQYAQTENQYRQTAQAYGFDPNRVVLDYNIPQPTGPIANPRRDYQLTLPPEQRPTLGGTT